MVQVEISDNAVEVVRRAEYSGRSIIRHLRDYGYGRIDEKVGLSSVYIKILINAIYEPYVNTNIEYTYFSHMPYNITYTITIIVIKNSL